MDLRALLFMSLFSLFMISCGSRHGQDSHLTELEGTDQKDHLFFVFGGGYSPQGSQVVLERNLQLFDEVATNHGIMDKQITRLFAAGLNSDIKDVQVREQVPTPKESLFHQLLGVKGCAGCEYRSNQLDNIDGGIQKETVVEYLERAVQQAEGQDTLNFYYTGHGSYTQGRYDRNFLALWRSQLNVQEYATILDKLDPQTHSQTVMVQCYSGGFAQINFVGGDSNKGLSEANRCGFFSQLRDRLAAGCSPDLNQREEYSPYFFAAYQGQDERGRIVDADYNGDGQITSNEAHAYVLMHENSIDIPVTTSSELLRSSLSLSVNDLQSFPWTTVVTSLDAVERKVLEHLGQTLGVDFIGSKDPIMEYIQPGMSTLSQESSVLQRQLNIYIQTNIEPALTEVQQWLQDRHPDFQLSTRISNDAQLLENVQKTFESWNGYNDLLDAWEIFNQQQEQLQEVQRQLAKWGRAFYLIQTKIMEAKLSSQTAQLDVVAKRYQQLQSCEAQSFFK